MNDVERRRILGGIRGLSHKLVLESTNYDFGPKVMRRIVAHFSSLFRSRFERELVSRPQLDDQAFYDAHYVGGGIPEDIPIRVRKVCIQPFGDCWKGVRPDDDLCDSNPELDQAELLHEIEDEFGIASPDEDMKQMGGSVDAIVRFIASQRHSLS